MQSETRGQVLQEQLDRLEAIDPERLTPAEEEQIRRLQLQLRELRGKRFRAPGIDYSRSPELPREEWDVENEADFLDEVEAMEQYLRENGYDE